jgi:hypothetical protein
MKTIKYRILYSLENGKYCIQIYNWPFGWLSLQIKKYYLTGDQWEIEYFDTPEQIKNKLKQLQMNEALPQLKECL